GVEEVAPELQRALDRARGLLLVGASVESRHAHAAETDLRHLGTVGSEPARVHVPLLSVRGSPPPARARRSRRVYQRAQGACPRRPRLLLTVTCSRLTCQTC